jgi:hypothetical protein
MLVAWAVISSGPSRWRWLILAHPVLTVLVVVGTGNHFWADGIVACAIVALVLAAMTALPRRISRRVHALRSTRDRITRPGPLMSSTRLCPAPGCIRATVGWRGGRGSLGRGRP